MKVRFTLWSIGEPEEDAEVMDPDLAITNGAPELRFATDDNAWVCVRLESSATAKPTGIITPPVRLLYGTEGLALVEIPHTWHTPQLTLMLGPRVVVIAFHARQLPPRMLEEDYREGLAELAIYTTLIVPSPEAESSVRKYLN